MTQPTSEALSDEELAEIRNRVVPVHSTQTKRLLATLDQALARCEAAEARVERLTAAILKIDSSAVSLGEDADGWTAIGYYVPIGPIHKALGVIGHCAVKAEAHPPEYVVNLLARAITRTKATRTLADTPPASAAQPEPDTGGADG